MTRNRGLYGGDEQADQLTLEIHHFPCRQHKKRCRRMVEVAMFLGGGLCKWGWGKRGLGSGTILWPAIYQPRLTLRPTHISLPCNTRFMTPNKRLIR